MEAFSEAEPANPPAPAPAPPVLEQEASEHIIMPQEDRDSATSDADTQVFGQWAQLAQAAANRVHSESGLSEMELARPIMAEAGTMTPSHWLAKALLNSEDVEWTSVPLGSAKDFQWSLMPLARESPESSDEEGPARHELRSEPARAARARSASAAYQRMNSILECTWPRSVLATRVPGGPWPSISPAAWSRIGGGLELARLTSEPGLARRRILSENSIAAAEAPAPSASPSAPSFAPAEDISAALTLTPLTPLPPKAEACAPPASPRRERRRLRERRRTEPGGRSAGVQRPSLVSVEDPAPVQEFFVTAGGSSDSFHNVTTEFERQDSEVVERWLNKLREPLPMVAKLELDEVNQEPRRAGTLASLTSWQGEPSPRSPRHLQSCESVLIPVEDCPASRPSTAERRGPREANVGHAGHVFRPWTGGDVLRPKPRAKELRPQSAPEVPSHPRSAPTAREAHPAGAEAEAEVNFLPRAPAMCPKTQLRRIGRPASASTAASSRPSTPGRVHVAYATWLWETDVS
ncbi:unnamed protein product [Effrenium voratum]|nr:unnamed protein product [Effrenium voratum]